MARTARAEDGLRARTLPPPRGRVGQDLLPQRRDPGAVGDHLHGLVGEVGEAAQGPVHALSDLAHEAMEVIPDCPGVAALREEILAQTRRFLPASARAVRAIPLHHQALRQPLRQEPPRLGQDLLPQRRDPGAQSLVV
jgi:hypothetical protein